MKLNKANIKAIELNDDEYFLMNGRMDDNIDDYLVSSILGNAQAINELGEYYLNEKKDINMAVSLFTISSKYDNISALYNLGYIYKYGVDVDSDENLSNYYFNRALMLIDENEDEMKFLYPSLYYELAKDIVDSDDFDDLLVGFDFLTDAKVGFSLHIDKFKDKYDEVNDLLNSKKFDEIRTMYEQEEMDECDDDCCCGGHCH